MRYTSIMLLISLAIIVLLLVSGCEVIHPAPMPAHPAYAVSLGRPYTLKVIDTDMRRVVHQVPLSDFPGPSVAVAPNGKVYVPIQGGAGVTGRTVAIYTPGAYHVKEVRVGNDPWAVIAAPDGKIYVMNMESGRHGTLSVVDSTSDQVVGTIDIGLMPWAMALSDDGRWLYVARDDPYYLYGKPFGFDRNPRPDEPPPAPATIAVVDTQESRVVKIVGLAEGSFPQALVWTKNKLYLALGSSQVEPDPKTTAGVALGRKVIVLEAATLVVLKRIEIPPCPDEMTLAPNGKLYVKHFIRDGRDSGGVTVIDTNLDEVIKELPLPMGSQSGFGMATPIELYVSGSRIVDTTTDQVIAEPQWDRATVEIGSFSSLVGGWKR